MGGTTDAVLVHKRKKLTIFFSDIVNFSAITDSVESELLSEVLNQYLNRMAEVAMKWGGTIDKFIGDGVMVFFGDPEFIDDVTHARQCARMALDMHRELAKLRSQWRELGMFHKLRVRMGINTGFCTVGNFGSNNRMEYTIVGGQVNIASRLEAIAEPDSIYISNSTFALIQDIAECEFVDDITVKGVHYPIEVYKLLELKGDDAPAGPVFADREKQLHVKRDLLRSYNQQREGTGGNQESPELGHAHPGAGRPVPTQAEQTDRRASQAAAP